MLLELAILFVLIMVAVLAYYVSKEVPDEVPVARRYIELATDALFLIIIGITIWAFNLKIVAIAIPIAIIVARRLWSITRLYAPITGAILAISILTNITTTIIILVLVLNYLIGIQAKNIKTVLRNLWLQPIAAIIIYAILYLTQAI